MKYDMDDLLLLNMAGIGYARLKSLIDYFGSAGKVVSARGERLQEIERMGPLLAQKIYNIKKDAQALKREWSLIKKHRVNLLSLFDEGYPESLKNIHNPPIVLYVRGKLLSQDQVAVSFVGSRRASLYGMSVCQDLSHALARLGITIVSGLARGIDSAGHKGALGANGRTVAVLGNGLASVYPPENRRLADEIAQSGAVISEFPMERPPLPQNFPIRNRIISGFSLGVVVVEAAQKSGALITAQCALDQGREVFAVPGKVGAVTSTGTHRLIRDGAKLVETANDIIEELNLDLMPQKKMAVEVEYTTDGTDFSSIFTALSELEKKLYDMLSDEPEHIDSIIDKCDLPVQEVARLLSGLEVKKVIKELPGKNFVTVK